MRYRPEIDGLRSIAVAPVVLFHLGFDTFSGGYVGVDIFFVISGYLITSIIYEEIRQDSFSLLRFYERRIRRILPALVAVCLACVILGWFFLLPEEYEAFGVSLFASSLFVSNVLFWSESGYFDADAETKPLLHTWSLSVEEQFYVVFPLLLMALAKLFKFRGLHVVLWTGVVVSLVFANWSVHNMPNAAFYLAPSRAWELGLGALLATRAVPAITDGRLATLVSATGIAAIGYAVFGFDSATPFPGVAALAPCLGTAFIIHAEQCKQTIVGRVLSVRGFVFIGLVSYSLYLWHWPVAVFHQYLAQTEHTSLWMSALLLAISLAAAIFSWRFIERPFRSRKGIFTPRVMLVLGAVSIGVFSLVGAVIGKLDGVPSRLPIPVTRIADAASDTPQRTACYMLSAAEVNDRQFCKIGPQDRPPTFIVWGDSHAFAIMPAFEELATRHGEAGLYAPFGSCAPLVGTTREDRAAARKGRCVAFNTAVIEHITDTPSIAQVILVGRWAENFEQVRFRKGGAPLVLRDRISPQTTDTNSSVFVRSFERTISQLTKIERKILVVAQVPDLPFNAPRKLASQALVGHQLTQSFPAREYEARQAPVMKFIDEMAVKYGFAVTYPHRYLCDDEKCRVKDNDVMLYRDDTHLSATGARAVSAVIEADFLTLLR
jgi:peptidoglycan/LPS O-acetylase OafA/YrhL